MFCARRVRRGAFCCALGRGLLLLMLLVRHSFTSRFLKYSPRFQVDDKIFCIHGGLSPDLNSMEQIRRILRPTDVPDTGLLCDVLWADPDPNIRGWAESDRGVSFTFGADIVEKFNRKHVSVNAVGFSCWSAEV